MPSVFFTLDFAERVYQAFMSRDKVQGRKEVLGVSEEFWHLWSNPVPHMCIRPERTHQQMLSKLADTLAQLHPNSLTGHDYRKALQTEKKGDLVNYKPVIISASGKLM